MKNFKDFLTEVKNDTDKHDNNPKTKDDNLTFTFGRFNPPHIGHEKLVNAVHAKSKGGDYRIYASQSQDPKKNPLHPEEKMKYMQHFFPDHANNIHNNANNVFDILKGAHQEGYKSVHIVVGADRVKEFEHLANKYNGSDMYNFKKIKVSSAGERHDNEDGGVEGMSASKMRKYAQSNDHQLFHSGMPVHVDPEVSKELMQKVQERMSEAQKKKEKKPSTKKTTTKEQFELWEIAPKLDRDGLRENYMAGNIFEVGSYVQHLDTGISGKVIHRGTNYVIYVDENDNSYRGWLTQLAEGANPKTQWEIGTDAYRKAVQKLTPGQPVKKFSDFVADGTNSAIWTVKYQLKDTGAKYHYQTVTGVNQREALIKAKAKLTTAKIVGLPQRNFKHK
jgi:nicotinamide mononucleotide adenylyltransferase